MISRPRACIVGAGPIGLMTARALSDRGWAVTVVHADDPARPAATFVGPAAAGLIEPRAFS